MFIAIRDAKCSRLRRRRAGHDGFSQRQTTSSSSRRSALPHSGHVAGISHGAAPSGCGRIAVDHLRDDVAALLDHDACRRRGHPCARRPRRCAASPSRSCDPASSTGSSTAYGVTAPVRPTLTSIRSQLRVRLLRRELERGRPARELRRRAEPLAQRQLVHLDDDAVGVEVERPPALVGPLLAEASDHSSLPVAARRSAAAHREPRSPHRGSIPAWPRDGRSFEVGLRPDT